MPRLIRKMAMVVAGTLMVQSSLSVTSVYAHETAPIVAQSIKTTPSTSSTKGDISTTIRFDYPITYEKVKGQNIKVVLKKDGKSIVEIKPGATQEVVKNTGNYPVEVTPKNTENVERTTEDIIGFYDIEIKNLELGTYEFVYEGDGYKTYTSGEIVLEDYTKKVIVGTGDQTFSYGDLKRDNKIDENDLKAIEEDIRTGQNTCDLNGDSKVDILDLTYIKHQLEAFGTEKQYNVSAIIKQEVLAAAEKSLEEAGLELANGASITDLFTGESSVKIEKTSEEGELQIPLDLGEDGIEAQVIEFASPMGEGGVESGTVLVEYWDEEEQKDKTAEQPFSTSTEGINLLSRAGASNTIVINLGKRVPVKRITISVEKVLGVDGSPNYVVMEEVSFIKDIVSNVSPVDKSIVKNLEVLAKDKEVFLTWDTVPNVEGYIAICKDTSGNVIKEVPTNINSATIQGLENFKTYRFTVRAKSGEWMGTPSEEYSATPQPSKPPIKPDNLSIEEMNGKLNLSWKKAEDATYYKVFYKESDSSDTDYEQLKPVNSDGKITMTSAVISGLTNDVAYDVYVIAGNSKGESSRSDIATGTPKAITVEGPILPTRNKISVDLIENIVMSDPGNIDWSQYKEFNTQYMPGSNKDGIKNIVDGDYATHWTAEAGQYTRSEEMTYTFTKPIEMNYLIYVDRIDRVYNQDWYYTLTIWEDQEGSSEPVKKMVKVDTTKRKVAKNGQEYYIIEFPKQTVQRMSLQVEQGSYSSISEVVFYEYDSLADDIAKLFKDASFTQLAEGVTESSISALRDRLNAEDTYHAESAIFKQELELAEALLKQNQTQLGIIKEGLVSINASTDVKKINDWSPLGIVGRANKQMVIYADIPDGEKVEIIPTQYYAEYSALSGSPIQLTKGRNVIDISKIGSLKETAGGSFYYRYSGTEGDQIKLHIRSINNSVVEIPTLEIYDWYNISDNERKSRISKYIDDLTSYNPKALDNLETNPENSTEISGRNILLSLPADRVLAGLEGIGLTKEEQIDRLYNNMLAWEEVAEVVHTTYGLENPKHVLNSRQNIRYMRMFGKAFMYAAGSHIGVGYGSTSALVQGEPTDLLGTATENGLFGWGIGHEIGHNMDRLGKTEITNNIYSLLLQTYDGKDNILKSRLELSDKYEDIYKKVAIGDKGMANDVFTQLGMYWQLHLAYDNGQKDTENGPLSFYNKLFTVYDSGDVDQFSGKENGKDDKFAVAASIVANKNLTEFFTKWGADLSENAKKAMAEYEIEERKIQYLTDESRRYRLDPEKVGLKEMNFTATAEVMESSNSESQDVVGNKVKISIQADSNVSKDVLGYEIFRDDKQIAFITGTTYEDVIGSANNKVFNYQVRAIDMLGNVINQNHKEGKLDIDPIRVEHDNVITNGYNIQFVKGDTQETDSITTESALVITFDKQTPVTGIRVKDEKGNELPKGSFEIVIGKEIDDEIEYTTAKESDFANNSAVDETKFITYFNKPGVSSEDTRIWTYDAKEIYITGAAITEDFWDKFTVEPLGYPGDNVAFEDYKVGILGEDYTYEVQEGDKVIEEVIPAGTLIVVGSYRGDPLYNTIQIIGKYAKKSEEASDVDEITYVDRPINGEVLMFAEIPEDGETSDISDGLFIFIPNIQEEEKLQGHCSQTSVLPTQIMAKMYRYDDIDNKEDRRITSTTLWYTTPSYDSMPEIILNQGETLSIQGDAYEKN